ncbi:ribosomal protein S7A, variant 2 [Balamuthia mandrillaris]
MYSARKKIVKEKGAEPDQFELSVANALHELEVNAADLQADLKSLVISSAKQIDVGGGKQAIVIFVPYTQLKGFHKIQNRLIRELEKKFSGQHVVIVANRRIIPKPGKNNRKKMQKRPRSRTLTAVHDAILEDLVYPTEIVGKRTRVRLDGSKLIKVYLDRKEQQNVEYKLDTFSKTYRRLTGKEVVFLFPSAPVAEK